MRLRRLLLPALLASLVAACAPEALVTRFHTLPPLPQGQTMALQAADPALQNSLEFQHYGAMAADLLAKAGYPPPPAGKAPDLIGRLGWRVEGARSEAYVNPIYGYTGGGYVVRNVGPTGQSMAVYVPPSYGVVDVVSGTRTYYTMLATLTVVDAKPPGAQRFEGRATTASLSPEIAPVMPLLIRALLANFPGRSGVTETVKPPDS